MWMIQVEGTIFEVTRNRLTEYSEVFADMFLMPRPEGSQEDPIFLEGYKAADFAALIKVLYPS